MKKFLIAPLLAGGLLFASPAAADSGIIDQYLEDLDTLGGFSVTEENKPYAIILGMAVCLDLYDGKTANDEVDYLLENGLSREQAATAITAAQFNLCPKTLKFYER